MWTKILSNRAGQIALKSLFGFFILILIGAFVFTVLPVFAWTEPTAAPPGSNVAAPLNTSDTSQEKSGALTTDSSFTAYGAVAIGGESGSSWRGLSIGYIPNVDPGLTLTGGQNLLYGALMENSSATSTFELFQSFHEKSATDVFKVGFNGDLWTKGDITGATVTGSSLCIGSDCKTSWPTSGGTPGGSNTQIQFNDSSSFGGNSGLTYDKTNQILTATAANASGGVAPLIINTGASSTSAYISAQLNGTEKGEFGVGDLCGGGSANGATICSPKRIVQFGGAGVTDMTVTANKVGIGETSPGYQLDIKNSADTGTAEMRLNQNNATALWTGVAMARQSSEKWFVGMDNSTDALLFRRGGSTNDMTIGTGGTVTIAGNLNINGATYTWPAAQPSGTKYLSNDGNGALSWAAVSATPGGSDTYVQYNNSSAFGGDANFTYDKSGTVTVGTAIKTPQLNVTGGGPSGVAGSTFTDSGVQAAGINYTLPPAIVGGGYLTTTVGGVLTWSKTSLTAHNLLSATHTDTVAGSAVRGDIIVANSTPAWTKLAIGSSGQVLTNDGSNTKWSTPTLPVTSSPTSGKVMIGDGTNWVASTPTYPNASATSGKVIISDGTNFIASTPTYPNSATQGDIIYASGGNTYANLSDVAVGSFLVSGGVGANPKYLAPQSCTTSGSTNCTIAGVRSGCTPICGPGNSSTGSPLAKASVSLTVLTCTFAATGTNTCNCICP